MAQTFNARLYDMPYQTPATPAANVSNDLKKIWTTTQQQLAKAETDLEEVISQRSNTPRLSRAELQAKDEEIYQLRSLVSSLRQNCQQHEYALKTAQSQIEKQNVQLNQQAETIKIHSNELSKFNDRPSKFGPSPCRLPSQFTQASSGQGPPPRFELTEEQHDRAFTYQQARQTATPVPSQQMAYRTKWGPIQHDQPYHNPHNLATQEDVFSSPSKARTIANGRDSPLLTAQMRSMSFQEQTSGPGSNNSTPPRTSLAPIGTRAQRISTPATSDGSNGALVPRAPMHTPNRSASVLSFPRSIKDGVIPYVGSSYSTQNNFAKEFSTFFDEVTKYAYDFVNFPSNSGDAAIPQNIKDRLLNLASPTTAHRLMADQKTRYYMITKLILVWINQYVFNEVTWMAGLDTDIDETIESIKPKLVNTPPNSIRAIYKLDLQRQITSLTRLPRFRDFFNQKINERTTDLFNIIRPLMYQKQDGDFQALFKIVREAHRIAERLFQDRAEYRFFFPKTNDRFNSASMINTDPEFADMAPNVIVAQHGLVKLGHVPQVMYQLTESSGESTKQTLIKAAVLIRFPDKERR